MELSFPKIWKLKIISLTWSACPHWISAGPIPHGQGGQEPRGSTKRAILFSEPGPPNEFLCIILVAVFGFLA